MNGAGGKATGKELQEAQKKARQRQEWELSKKSFAAKRSNVGRWNVAYRKSKNDSRPNYDAGKQSVDVFSWSKKPGKLKSVNVSDDSGKSRCASSRSKKDNWKSSASRKQNARGSPKLRMARRCMPGCKPMDSRGSMTQ